MGRLYAVGNQRPNFIVLNVNFLRDGPVRVEKVFAPEPCLVVAAAPDPFSYSFQRSLCPAYLVVLKVCAALLETLGP